MAHPEALLISAVTKAGDYTTPVAQGITPDMFHVFKDEWKYIEQYVQRYRKAPTRAIFKSKYPEFTFFKGEDIEHFCHEVKKEHVKFTLLGGIDKCMDLLDSGDTDGAAKFLHTSVMAVQSQVEGESESFDIFEDWQDTYQDVRSRMKRVADTGMAGVPTGFPTLDVNTGGLQPGWVTIVAARLGQGKTWTLIRMAWAAVSQGYNVSYFSLEQSRNQIALRTHGFASSKHGKELFKSLDLMRGENFNIKEYKEFLGNLKNDVAGAFYVNDTSRGRVSPLTIASHIEQRQPHIVFIDYLTLLEMSGGFKDKHNSVAALSADLKGVAERYGVPIVAASQVNRTGEGRDAPGPETIAQSDAIGQDADLILTMKRKSERVMLLKNAKFRHGPDGYTWFCKFSPGTGEYDEINGDTASTLMEEDQEVD